ncbi:hypothetical protein BDZ89DRAFT_1198167 [Hymenopellis radicata]|nr:hypothetical protein BDZ89DRAFT_1198167 [Hymenopellis radicata]
MPHAPTSHPPLSASDPPPISGSRYQLSTTIFSRSEAPKTRDAQEREMIERERAERERVCLMDQRDPKRQMASFQVHDEEPVRDLPGRRTLESRRWRRVELQWRAFSNTELGPSSLAPLVPPLRLSRGSDAQNVDERGSRRQSCLGDWPETWIHLRRRFKKAISWDYVRSGNTSFPLRVIIRGKNTTEDFPVQWFSLRIRLVNIEQRVTLRNLGASVDTASDPRIDMSGPRLSLEISESPASDHEDSVIPPILGTCALHNDVVCHRSATAPTSKRLAFASNLSVYDTFGANVYDQRRVQVASRITWFCLIRHLASYRDAPHTVPRPGDDVTTSRQSAPTSDTMEDVRPVEHAILPESGFENLHVDGFTPGRDFAHYWSPLVLGGGGFDVGDVGGNGSAPPQRSSTIARKSQPAVTSPELIERARRAVLAPLAAAEELKKPSKLLTQFSLAGIPTVDSTGYNIDSIYQVFNLVRYRGFNDAKKRGDIDNRALISGNEISVMALVAQIPTKTLPAYLDTFLYSLPLTAENADHNQRCLNNSELLTSLFPWFSRQEGGTIKLTRSSISLMTLFLVRRTAVSKVVHDLVLHCLYDNASSRLRLQQGRTEIPEIQTNNYI